MSFLSSHISLLTRSPLTLLSLSCVQVGSSTVGGTVRLALVSTTSNPFASCLRHSKLREKSEVERARYTCAYTDGRRNHGISLSMAPCHTLRRHSSIGPRWQTAPSAPSMTTRCCCSPSSDSRRCSAHLLQSASPLCSRPHLTLPRRWTSIAPCVRRWATRCGPAR